MKNEKRTKRFCLVYKSASFRRFFRHPESRRTKEKTFQRSNTVGIHCPFNASERHYNIITKVILARNFLFLMRLLTSVPIRGQEGRPCYMCEACLLFRRHGSYCTVPRDRQQLRATLKKQKIDYKARMFLFLINLIPCAPAAPLAMLRGVHDCKDKYTHTKQ